MMEASTPLRHDSGRRSIFGASSVVFSPLRRSNVGTSSTIAALEPVHDEQERSNRRSIVAIQRRFTNIASDLSPLVDTGPVMDERSVKDHLRICMKLFTENRISAKNAWQLHVIDVIRKIASTDKANVLQVAGSSLDIGAKVYGLRVDDVHAKGLQLASSMAKNNEIQSARGGGEEINLEASMHRRRRRNVKKKSKKMPADKKNTVEREEKGLYAPVKHIESVVFATKENIDVSATDNLFTHRIPVNPANHRFMLLTEEKYWSRMPDEVLDNGETLLKVELPQMTHYNLCPPFKEFETGTWDPEEEEQLLAVLDDDGIPIAELDGSVHDIFEDNHDIDEDPASDVEEHQEVFQAQIQAEIAHIVDAVPEENRIQSDYGYNTLVKTLSGKYMDKIWAGPSHWKVKFNRPSATRYSGSTVQQVKHTRQTRVQEKIDFSQFDDNICETLDKYTVRRASGTAVFEKITLPVPVLGLSPQCFHKLTSELLMKPGVPRPRLNNTFNQPQDYEVQVHNYENQHNSDDVNEEPMQHSFEEEAPIAAQQQFLDEDLVNAPETVSSTHIPYAMQAKKIDMKKFKSVIWKCLTQSSEDSQYINEGEIKQMLFSELYHELPQLLSTDMKKEFSCPLTLVTLLHLCNENNLELRQDSYEDFTIMKATE